MSEPMRLDARIIGRIGVKSVELLIDVEALRRILREAMPRT